MAQGYAGAGEKAGVVKGEEGEGVWGRKLGGVVR